MGIEAADFFPITRHSIKWQFSSCLSKLEYTWNSYSTCFHIRRYIIVLGENRNYFLFKEKSHIQCFIIIL
jgi:hypothetical protein